MIDAKKGEPEVAQEARYEVFNDSDGNPWVSRLRLSRSSPGGRVQYWEPTDAIDCQPIKYDGGDLPELSPEAAIDRYQNARICWLIKDRRGAVREIVAAERLRGDLADPPTQHPSNSSSSNPPTWPT